MSAEFHYELRAQFSVDDPNKAEELYHQIHELISDAADGQVMSWLSPADLQITLPNQTGNR